MSDVTCWLQLQKMMEGGSELRAGGGRRFLLLALLGMLSGYVCVLPPLPARKIVTNLIRYLWVKAQFK